MANQSPAISGTSISRDHHADGVGEGDLATTRGGTTLSPTACPKSRTASSAQNATQLGSTTCTHNHPVGNT